MDKSIGTQRDYSQLNIADMAETAENYWECRNTGYIGLENWNSLEYNIQKIIIFTVSLPLIFLILFLVALGNR